MLLQQAQDLQPSCQSNLSVYATAPDLGRAAVD